MSRTTTTTTGPHDGSRHVDAAQEIKKKGLQMFGITKNDEEQKKKAQTMVYTVVWALSKFLHFFFLSFYVLRQFTRHHLPPGHLNASPTHRDK
jgi:hypothetical protein